MSMASFNTCVNPDDGNKPGEVLNVLRWVPSVVGTTAPYEAPINEVLREKPVLIIPKIPEI
jgi:hypothetical protein